MIPSPFPENVGFASVKAEDSMIDQLLPEEAQWTKKLKSISRRAEFAAGRIAARKAAESIGLRLNKAILPSKDRFPLWIEPVLGSISHTHGIAAAAIAPKNPVSALGLDLEDCARTIDYKLEARILLGAEREWVSSDPTLSQERLLRIFSAKECVYKALFPVTGITLTFRDALLIWNSQQKVFDCTISKNLGEKFSALQNSQVHSTICEGYLVSGLVL